MDRFIYRSNYIPSLTGGRSKRPSDTELEWKTPKRVAPTAQLQFQQPVKTSNKFSVLPADQGSSAANPQLREATLKRNSGVAGVYSNDTTVSAWPSLVQVEDRLVGIWIQQCVGSLITSSHVLTAATCTTPNVSTRRLRAGADERHTGGQVREANAIIVHYNYGTLGKDSNIALIRTVSPFILGPGVQQAQILGEGIQLPVNLEVTFVGWGATAAAAGENNNRLKELNLRVNDIDACTNKYLSAASSEVITENMICSGRTYNSGLDIDTRDIGAPIFYSGVIVGVTSFGVTNGDNELPIVASAISSYTSWIVEVAS